MKTEPKPFFVLAICGTLVVAALLGSSLALSGEALAHDPAAPPVAEHSAESEKAPPESKPIELSMTVTLEDDARDPLKFVLTDGYSRPVKTWENVAPGSVHLELPKLESDRYLLTVSASGYGLGRTRIDRFQAGHSGERRIAGALSTALRDSAVRGQSARRAHVKRAVRQRRRVAISFGSVPDLHGDWLINQAKASPVFSFHRFGANGFVRPAEGTSFEEIDLAPQPDQYTPESIVATKGMILLNLIEGNGPRDRRYAKIHVEEITESPPKDSSGHRHAPSANDLEGTTARQER